VVGVAVSVLRTLVVDPRSAGAVVASVPQAVAAPTATIAATTGVARGRSACATALVDDWIRSDTDTACDDDPHAGNGGDGGEVGTATRGVPITCCTFPCARSLRRWS
jgi:hypothetical protein